MPPSSFEIPPPRTFPTAPPCSLPSVTSSPTTVKARPVRNGFTSRSALRKSISPPTTTSASGATYAADPIRSPSQPSIFSPATPPSQPR